MPTNLNALKQFLLPTTGEQVRLARLAAEDAPDEPGFVFALEFEMRAEFLACAEAVKQAQAAGKPALDQSCDER